MPKTLKSQIQQLKSPNFDTRGGADIDILLMHYTGMETGEAAIERLCSQEAGVSSHYVVEEDGRIFQLVDEAERAWHAGVSHWAGDEDINARSIGIEIVNPGHEFGYRQFPKEQIDTVIELSQGILSRRAIPPTRVIGHSDVAPTRKQDPGELFPWQRLAFKGIGRFIDPGSVEPVAGKDIGPGDTGWQVQEYQNNLKAFGYKTEVTGAFDEATVITTLAFQRHFRPEAMNGLGDLHTLELLRTYVNFRG
jgi:N-acetylmuramoyl-L-alanine amidase